MKRFILMACICIKYADHQHWNLPRSYKLVSTSNRRPSSGEMKIDLKRVGIYKKMDLTLILNKDESVKINKTYLYGHILEDLLVGLTQTRKVGDQYKELSQAPMSIDKVAPPSQIPVLNLTQFNNIGTFRPNEHQHIPRHSIWTCRARNLQNWVVLSQNSNLKHRPAL